MKRFRHARLLLQPANWKICRSLHYAPFTFLAQRNLHVSWIEYLGICRRIRSYKRVSAQTATGCKNHCATDQQCAMVKYHQVKKRCWLSKSTKMRVTKVCPADYDFYVKGNNYTLRRTCIPIRPPVGDSCLCASFCLHVFDSLYDCMSVCVLVSLTACLPQAGLYLSVRLSSCLYVFVSVYLHVFFSLFTCVCV